MRHRRSTDERVIDCIAREGCKQEVPLTSAEEWDLSGGTWQPTNPSNCAYLQMFWHASLSMKRFGSDSATSLGYLGCCAPLRLLFLTFAPEILSQLSLLLFDWLQSHPLTKSIPVLMMGVGWTYLVASLLFLIYMSFYSPRMHGGGYKANL